MLNAIIEPGDPTPDEIAAACKEIRSNWTDEECERRRAAAPDQTPLVDCRCSECGRLGVSPCTYCESVRFRRDHPGGDIADPPPTETPHLRRVFRDELDYLDGKKQRPKKTNNEHHDGY